MNLKSALLRPQRMYNPTAIHSTVSNANVVTVEIGFPYLAECKHYRKLVAAMGFHLYHFHYAVARNKRWGKVMSAASASRPAGPRSAAVPRCACWGELGVLQRKDGVLFLGLQRYRPALPCQREGEQSMSANAPFAG